MDYNKLLSILVLFLFFSISIYAQSTNTKPTADAGADMNVEVGEEAELQGSGLDMENDPLTFTWAIVFKPVGSKATLSDNNIHNPTFIADVEGDYMFNLRVNDGMLKSLPDTITYTAQINLSENNKSIARDEERTDIIIIDESPRRCPEGNCNLDAKQWCNDGVFVSEGYCEHCGNEDSSCLSGIGGFCREDSDCETYLMCVSGVCSEKSGKDITPDEVEEEIEKDAAISEPARESNGLFGTLFWIVILIIVFGAGSYGFYYYKDYIIKHRAKKSVSRNVFKRILMTSEEKKKIKQVVKKKRKAKKEKREEFFEAFFNNKDKK